MWGAPSEVRGMKNAPFSATGKSTFDIKLWGGNTIHGVLLSRTARDSAGRTRVERIRRCWHGQDGNIHAEWTVVVNDNVAGKSLSWDIGDLVLKVVYVKPFPANPQSPTPEEFNPLSPTPEELARQKREAELNQPPQNWLQIKDLGTKKINGISVEGKRATRTIAAGEEGNDRPMTRVDEVWNSKELGEKLMLIEEDPRGRTVYEMEDVKLQEPDASLFAAPSGYRVEEIKPVNQGR
jgi:hypothetical protein